MWRLTLAVVLASAPAHAMGADVSVDLVAWNADGSAALVRRTTLWDGQRQSKYVIVADAEPVSAMFDDGRDTTQNVDDAGCIKAAGALTRALAADQFRGVTVHADRCAGARASIVAVDPDVARDVARSWVVVPIPMTEPKPGREHAVWESLVATGEDPSSASRDSCDAFTAATMHGGVVLLFENYRCGTPNQTKLRVFVPGHVEHNSL
jgi:hypothetical protein